MHGVVGVPYADLPVKLSLQGFGAASIIDHQVMTHTMLEAVNTAKDKLNVAPHKGSGAKVSDGVLDVVLKPYSYSMIRLKTTA